LEDFLKFKEIQLFCVPIAGSIVAAFALFLWSWDESRISHKTVYTSLEREATLISGTLRGIITSELGSSRSVKDSLQLIINNIAYEIDLSYLSLSSREGTLIELGTPPHEKFLRGENGTNMRNKTYYMWKNISIPFRKATKAFKTSKAGLGKINKKPIKFKFVVGVDAEGHLLRLEQNTQRINLIVILGLAAIAALTLLSILIIKNYKLRERFKRIKNRSNQFIDFELAAFGLAHEAKHPLGIIRALAQNITDSPNLDSSVREKAEDIMQEADVTSSRLSEFMDYAKIRTIDLQECEWAKMAAKLQCVLASDCEQLDIELIFDRQEVIVMADHDMLQRVLLNLISNSLRSCCSGDSVKVTLSPSGSRYNLVVEDSGCGIDKNILPTIFQPYVTGNSGSGIGLAVVKRIVDAHGWEINVNSEPDKGTTFEINSIQGISI